MRHTEQRPRVVIVGGGFAGVECAKGFEGVAVDVTLIDKRNFHLFQPLLYQVATGGLSPGDIAAPLRSVLRDLDNVRVLLGDVIDLDVDGKSIELEGGAGRERLEYDFLVIATGARHSYFGNDHWERFAPGLKTIEDATEIRARVLKAFEEAERAHDEAARAAWLTFVIVGGGPTGVELAGALAELSRHTMKGEFRAIDAGHARVLLVEGAPRILGGFTAELSAHAVEALNDLDVAVVRSAKVVGLDEGGVDIETSHGKERIPARTVLWAAGVQASPLSAVIAERTGAARDRAGRVVVEADCSVAGHPDIFVAGDLAHFAHTKDKQPLPGMSPVALQMGRHIARTIQGRVVGARGGTFRYFDKGAMAVIGRNKAVARLGIVNWGMRGFLAWVAWLLVHIVFLVEFENKLLVLIQWANHYFTRHRGARLIAPVRVGENEGAEARATPDTKRDAA